MFDGTFDGQSSDGLGSFVFGMDKYTSGAIPPGQYTVTIRGRPEKALDGRSEDASFILTLVDPCDPPNSITSPSNPGFENQSYILFDAEKVYTHPPFSAVPAECPLKYKYTKTSLSGGASAVEQDALDSKTFKIQWDTDLSPLGQTESIRVEVESYSIYGTNAAVVERAEGTFTVGYENPCFNVNFIELDENNDVILSDIQYPVGYGEIRVPHDDISITAVD